MADSEIMIITYGSLRKISSLRRALAYAHSGVHILILDPRCEDKLLRSRQERVTFQPNDFRAHFRSVSENPPSGKDQQMGSWHSFEPNKVPSRGKLWTWARELDGYDNSLNAYIPFQYRNFEAGFFGKPKRLVSGNAQDGFHY